MASKYVCEKMCVCVGVCVCGIECRGSQCHGALANGRVEEENWVRQKVDANVHTVDAHTCVAETEIESDRKRRGRGASGQKLQ